MLPFPVRLRPELLDDFFLAPDKHLEILRQHLEELSAEPDVVVFVVDGRLLLEVSADGEVVGASLGEGAEFVEVDDVVKGFGWVEGHVGVEEAGEDRLEVFLGDSGGIAGGGGVGWEVEEEGAWDVWLGGV